MTIRVVMLVPDFFSDRQKAALALGDQISKCHFLLVSLLGHLHSELTVPASARSVLRQIIEEGPRTVPDMARARSVSRQFIQTVANELLEEGYLERILNPKSRKSPLLAITQRGQDFVSKLYEREGVLLHRAVAETGVSIDDLDSCRATLQRLRDEMENMDQAMRETGTADCQSQTKGATQ